MQVWFARGKHLLLTGRAKPSTPAIGAASLLALLNGPSGDESEAGATTSIPPGTNLLSLSISQGTATVNFSGDFASGAGASSDRMRLAEVVYTITQFSTVKRVKFELEGKPVSVFGSAGIPLDHPLARRDYTDLLSAIVVGAPLIGQSVSSPVLVSGNADVFEATVSIQVLDQSGRIVGRTFTTATCGTGCRGTYSAKIRFHVASTQPGTILVFEVSAESGKPINTQRIPVTLTTA